MNSTSALAPHLSPPPDSPKPKVDRFDAWVKEIEARERKVFTDTTATSGDLQYLRGAFNADNIRSRARNGLSEAVSHSAWQVGATTLREVYDHSYALLRKHYPVEYVLKNELINWARKQYAGAFIKTEHYMNGQYADVVLITPHHSIAYEVKTKYDSPKRLKDQVNAYYTICDEVVLVCNEGHSLRYAKHVPDTVGLLSVGRAGGVQMLRETTRHDEHLSVHQMLCSLLKKERVAFLKDAFPDKKYHYTYDHQYTYLASKTFTPEEVHSLMKKYWSQRESIRWLSLIDEIPDSLTTAMYDYRINKGEWRKFIALLDQPLEPYVPK